MGSATKARLFTKVWDRFRSKVVRRTLLVGTSFGAGLLFAGVEHFHGISAASWVQAVGSILAIIAAIWVANKQHQQSLHLVELEQRRIERQKLLEALEVQNFMDEVLKDAKDALEALAAAGYGSKEFSAAIAGCTTAGIVTHKQIEHMRGHIEFGVRSARACQIMLDVTKNMQSTQSFSSDQMPKMNGWAQTRLGRLATARELLGPIDPVANIQK